MTSSAHDAEYKGNNFRRTTHPQSFIAVAFIFSELNGDGGEGGLSEPPLRSRRSGKKKPGLDRTRTIALIFFPSSIYVECQYQSGYQLTNRVVYTPVKLSFLFQGHFSVLIARVIFFLMIMTRISRFLTVQTPHKPSVNWPSPVSKQQE